MNMPEIILLIKAIDTNYRIPVKNEKQLNESAKTMLKILEPYDYKEIERAAVRFMRNGSAFPPNPGQLITLAAEIRRAEYDERQRQTDLLPEPETERIPMPDDIREKMRALFRLPYKD